eukprot:EG_transcript_4311
MPIVTKTKSVTISVRTETAPKPELQCTEEEQLQQALQEAEVRNESLQGRLLRCQQVLDAIRSTLHTETCLLKEKVYQRTQTGELLEMEVCSLLDVMMEFLRQQAGDIFQDPLHYRKTYSTLTSSNGEDPGLALEIAHIRKKLHMEAMVTEGRLRQEISIRDQQLIEYREQLERCNPALFQKRLQSVMQEVQVLRATVRDTRNAVYDTWKQESAEMTTDVVMAAQKADQRRQADRQHMFQTTQTALRTCVSHLEQSVQHHRSELKKAYPDADIGEAVASHNRPWIRNALQALPDGTDGTPSFLSELRGLAKAITDSCIVTDAYAARLKRVRDQCVLDVEQRLQPQLRGLEEQLAQRTADLAAALALARRQPEAQAAAVAAERARGEALAQQLEERHAADVRALTATYEAQLRRAEKDDKWFADRLETTVRERLASLALEKDREMVALIEAKDQQIRFIKESLQPEQPEPNSHALEMKVSEVLETKNAAVQCTLLSPTKDDQLLEAIGLLRREQIELQTRVRTAEEAQFGAEQDAVGLRAQLEEARRGLTWYVGELKSALERRNEEARRKSEMVDVGVDVAWESRQVGGYKVTRDKKMQTENATLQQASTQTITEDRPPQTLPKPESIRRPSPMIHVIEALPPTFPTEPHDVDPHFDLDEPQHILDPQLSTIFRNDGLSFSQSEAPKKPDDTKPSRGETPSAAVETQTSARRTAEVGVLANLGLEMSATEPAVQLS